MIKVRLKSEIAVFNNKYNTSYLFTGRFPTKKIKTKKKKKEGKIKICCCASSMMSFYASSLNRNDDMCAQISLNQLYMTFGLYSSYHGSYILFKVKKIMTINPSSQTNDLFKRRLSDPSIYQMLK